MATHKLLNKSDRFFITYNKVNTKEFYKIDLVLTHWFWTDPELLSEYSQFFDPDNTKANGKGWVYDNEEEARALYTWAILKWCNNET